MPSSGGNRKEGFIPGLDWKQHQTQAGKHDVTTRVTSAPQDPPKPLQKLSRPVCQGGPTAAVEAGSHIKLPGVLLCRVFPMLVHDDKP